MRRLERTVLVILLPLLFLWVVGAFGSPGVGSWEYQILSVCWVLGLTYVWWPRSKGPSGS
jgi:hypothetical protein